MNGEKIKNKQGISAEELVLVACETIDANETFISSTGLLVERQLAATRSSLSASKW